MMSAQNDFERMMVQVGDIGPAMEAHLQELGWDAERCGTAGNSALCWNLWAGPRSNCRLRPPYFVLDPVQGCVKIAHKRRTTTYELADPESLKRMDYRLGCILRATKKFYGDK